MPRIALAFGVVFVVAFSAFAALQGPTQNTLRFEVASVKPSPEKFDVLASLPRQAVGRLFLSSPVRVLIARAYGLDALLDSSRIVGGPSSVLSRRFDIVAKAKNPEATPAQMNQMLQTLLIERFRLKVHREMREVDISVLKVPAMMRIAITTPEIMEALQLRQRRWPYAGRVKPFNFVLSPPIDPDGGYPQGTTAGGFTLIAPFTSDTSRWLELEWINLYDDSGKTYRLARPGHHRLASEAEAKSYGDIVSQYRWHAEAKSLAPDAGPCMDTTTGLLQRMPVLAAQQFRSIGKETDRRWEGEDDISLLNPRLVEYRPQESARLVADPSLQHRVRRHSIRALAKAAGVTPKVIKTMRRGQRIRKSTARKIERALRDLETTRSSQV